jgi:succinate dehydrogenase/fumarate reductase flavoprotein subunit
VAAAAIAAGSVAVSKDTAPAHADAAAQPGRSIPESYRVYETDVVIVGGGIAGMMAAHTVLQNAVNTIIVDKGPFGHSGASGINWGAAVSPVMVEPGKALAVTEGTSNQALDTSLERLLADWSQIDIGTKAGSVYERSEEDGSVRWPIAQCYMTRLMAHYVKNLGAQVLDRTMVTDVLLAEDGSVAGVVGLDQMGGEAVVVRAKSVIIAMGGGQSIYGWNTAGPNTCAGMENTGDGSGIMLKHGLPLHGFEFTSNYGYACYPDGIAYSQGVGVQSSDHPLNLMNSEGTYFTRQAVEENPDLQDMGNFFPLYWRLVMREILAGRVSEENGYYLDTTGIDTTEWYTWSRHMKADLKAAFDWDIPNPCELRLAPFATSAQPVFDVETGQTAIPGMFYAGETESGDDAAYSSQLGRLSGLNASVYAKALDTSKAPAQEDLEIAVAEIYNAYKNDCEGGKRPIEIIHAIQDTVFNKAWYLCDDASLNEALAELTRIWEEEIPQMTIADTSRQMNTEWKQALVVPLMWRSAMGIATARLARTETRRTHFRKDYPRLDNDTMLKSILVRQEGDISFTTEDKDIVTVYMGLDEIREGLAKVAEFSIC